MASSAAVWPHDPASSSKPPKTCTRSSVMPAASEYCAKCQMMVATMVQIAQAHATEGLTNCFIAWKGRTPLQRV